MIGIIVKLPKAKRLAVEVKTATSMSPLINGDKLRMFNNDVSEWVKEGDRVGFYLINQKRKGMFAYIHVIKNNHKNE